MSRICRISRVPGHNYIDFAVLEFKTHIPGELSIRNDIIERGDLLIVARDCKVESWLSGGSKEFRFFGRSNSDSKEYPLDTIERSLANESGIEIVQRASPGRTENPTSVFNTVALQRADRLLFQSARSDVEEVEQRNASKSKESAVFY